MALRKILAEVYIDESAGVVAVKMVGGHYRVYIDPEGVTMTNHGMFGSSQQRLSNMPGIANTIIDTKTAILRDL